MRKMRLVRQTSVTLAVFFLVFLCQNVSSELPPASSTIDDCCCQVDSVLTENSSLHAILNALVQKTFFKYFKVDLYQDCSYWAVEHLCGLSGGCGICECDENEIPLAWKQEDTTDLVNDPGKPQNFQKWDDTQGNLWTAPQPDDAVPVYVNLIANPEGYTGYSQGRQIWEVIYQENCFPDESSWCLEQRLLFRLISGLHTSITMHLSRYHHPDVSVPATTVTGPREWTYDLETFNNSIFQHPDRVSNLYFTFVFVLRSIQKAAPFLEHYPYLTGNTVEDAQVRAQMQTLLKSKLLCGRSFDESILFQGDEKEALKQQFQMYFRNISRLMDCVSCEKCKLWGKLQTLGLGTALKIVMSNNGDGFFDLQRNEIVALINLARQLSDSIDNVNEMSKLVREAQKCPKQQQLEQQKREQQHVTDKEDTSNESSGHPVDRSSKSSRGFFWVGAGLTILVCVVVFLWLSKGLPMSKQLSSKTHNSNVRKLKKTQ